MACDMCLAEEVLPSGPEHSGARPRGAPYVAPPARDLLRARDLADPSLSTSGETLIIGESMNLEGENGVRRNVGDNEYERSWGSG